MRRRVGAALVGLAVVFGARIEAEAADDDRQQGVHRLGPIEVLGDGANYVEVGVGVFDMFKDVIFTDDEEEDRAAAGRVELRLGNKLYGLGPAVGLVATTDGGVFGYGGLYLDLVWGDVVITPLGGVGAYAEGGGKDLGGVFQFRVGVTVACGFAGGSRLGVHLGHLSNAGINGANPGEEDVFVTYALPF